VNGVKDPHSHLQWESSVEHRRPSTPTGERPSNALTVAGKPQIGNPMRPAMHTNELTLMSSRFTPRVVRVFQYARDEAAERGAAAIGTLHLVSAFARDGHGLLVRVFAAAHLSLTALGQEIGTVSAASGKPLASEELTLDGELDQVLQFAADEADNLSRPLISTEHLLLGILRAEDSAAGKLLHQKGMRLDATRAQVAALTARRSEPGSQHA
jgi:ATP-dependent Clp protease ATP-binding subunit ClpC